MPRVRLRGVLLGLAFALAFVMRFWGLRQQGLRFVDEGEYCFFGACLLHGVHGQIIDKPGHGLLIFLGFKVGGFSMASALWVSAALGFLSVVLTYRLAKDLWGDAEALLAAWLAAPLPFWLFYQRSAMSDGNYLFFSLLGWWLGWRAADGLDRWSSGRGLLFAASGLAFGLGFTVNPSTVLFAACTLAGLGVLCLMRRAARLPSALGAVVLILTGWVGREGVNGLLSPYIHWEGVRELYGFHAKWVLGFQPSLYFLRHLFHYASPLTLALAALGVGVAWRRRNSADVVAAVLLLGLVAFSARMSIRFPRLYLPLTVPVLLLAARAGVEICRGSRRPQVALLGLCMVGAGILFVKAAPMLALRSGYAEACESLKADGVRSGLTTHSWWTFQTFTGRRFRYVTEALAGILDSPDWRPKLQRNLKAMADQGATHLVIDYMFWIKASPQAIERLRSFVQERPPTFTIPNPAVAYPPTTAEDSTIPPWGGDPLACQILIYRLRDYL